MRIVQTFGGGPTLLEKMLTVPTFGGPWKMKEMIKTIKHFTRNPKPRCCGSGPRLLAKMRIVQTFGGGPPKMAKMLSEPTMELWKLITFN